MTKNCLHNRGSKIWGRAPLASIYLIIKKNLIKNVIKKVPEVLDKCRRVGVKWGYTNRKATNGNQKPNSSKESRRHN